MDASPLLTHKQKIFCMIARPNGSNDQSPDVRRTSQTNYKNRMGRGGKSSSGWGDGLVSLSFASRLQLRQDKPTTRDSGTESHPQEARSRKQKSHQVHPQMHGHRREHRQQDYGDSSQTQTRPRGKTENNKLKASLMTRPASSSTFKPKSTTAEATAAKATKADTTSLPSSSNASATQLQQRTTASSDRKARLATLSSTNLSALFRTTTNTPTAGMSIPSLPASTTASAPDSARARVRSILERSAGDYSRFLPRDVGVRKDASRLPPLRAARNALATQRDVSLEQRRVALHIIGVLVQPRREVGAS